MTTIDTDDATRDHATVFVILDAGRADYVRDDAMPFLNGLAEAGTRGSFESPPGFAQRTTMFSGRYPDESGNFSQFVFDPERSPFDWVQRLGPLRRLIRPRKLLVPTRWAIERVTKWKTGDFHTDPAWIPPEFMPYFAMCEDTEPVFAPGALGAPSLFDLCREHGLDFRYLAHPVSGDDEEVFDTLVRELRANEDYDLYLAQFSVTDEMGHKHGPFSEAMQDGFLRDVDAKLASIHALLDTRYDSWDLFVVGDHGMAPVEREVDVLGALADVDAEPAEDYVVFVNSTLAVFWYLTEQGRREVQAKLPEIEGARVLDEEERRERRIPREQRWGEDMLAAESGVLFWPDYFHVRDTTIRGMHGYLDKSTEGLGMAVLASSDAHAPDDFGARSLVDVFPTLCQLLGLPVPETQSGDSLLSAPREQPPVAQRTAPESSAGSPP
jgi:hypothetical protein